MELLYGDEIAHASGLRLATLSRWAARACVEFRLGVGVAARKAIPLP